MSNTAWRWLGPVGLIVLGLVGILAYAFWPQGNAEPSPQQKPVISEPKPQSTQDAKKDSIQEEKDNWSRLLRTRDAVQEARKPPGKDLSPLAERIERNHRWKVAQDQAKTVKPELLAKVHAELPDWFKRYRLLIENTASANEVGVPLREEHVTEGEKLTEWWEKNKADFRIPAGVTK